MLWETAMDESNSSGSNDCSMDLQSLKTHHQQPKGHHYNRLQRNTKSSYSQRQHHRMHPHSPYRQQQRPTNFSNMDSILPIQEMSIDDMSFYGEDDEVHEGNTDGMLSHHQQHQHHQLDQHDSEEMLLLLPEECSPQHLKTVNNKLKGSSLQNDEFFVGQMGNGRGGLFRGNAMSKLQTSPHVRMTNANQNGCPKSGSKSFRVFNSLSSTCSVESSMDDEYMELLEMESLDDNNENFSSFPGLPSNLNSLISGQIKTSLAKTPEIRRPSVRRCLSMTENAMMSPNVGYSMPKTPENQSLKLNDSSCLEAASTTPFSSRVASDQSSITPCFKRPDPPSSSASPVHPKRYRGEEKENLPFDASSLTSSIMAMPTATLPTAVRPLNYRRSISMNDAEIMTALTRCENSTEPDLIGDFSKPFALPLIEGRHRDLKTITSDTVARLIRGEFDDQVAHYSIIDCRYPYEFEGGHIRGAKNLYTQEQIVEEFLTQQKTEQQQALVKASGNKRNIIIFHCEFSSERGPKLSRFLRNHDRAQNTNSYPVLDYPEVYLLHNGYKEFYETHADLCDPNSYRPMLEPAFNDAYKHFRAKSKSWNCDGLGGGTTRLKKSRSRLML